MTILASPSKPRDSTATSEGRIFLDFHGVSVVVACDDPETRRRVGNDFSYFGVDSQPEGGADFEISTHRRAPDYDSLPPLVARIHTPRNICYSDGDTTYVDYFGRALGRLDRRRRTLHIESDDVFMLQEITYLALLSWVGEKLEGRRLHRIHALAVSKGDDAALFAMPSGGGKTTLAMEFLRSGAGYQVVSEDSPLIGRRGCVLPFPLRLGSLSEPADIDSRYITYIERMEFKPKYLISLEAFEGSFARNESRARFVFLGVRSLSRDCRITPAGLRASCRALLQHMVVGVGLYQGLEFLLQSSILDLAGKTPLFISRLLRAMRLLITADFLILELGRDTDRNRDSILEFLEEQSFGSK